MSQFPLGYRLDPRVQPELRHAPEAKWRRLILYFLAQGGPTRYGELRRAIRDVSDKMLIQQLKEAEADGLARGAVRVSAPSFYQESSTIIPPLSETRAKPHEQNLTPRAGPPTAWRVRFPCRPPSKIDVLESASQPGMSR
ncbi:helix-turn-helix domain-containing protein [Bradyrhizobium sp. CCGUVB14]|uniref:winged helix-turn-helix transcriptional regulator n=1 Tax=Bradyrhizobium sp. CCGUVB14 TaxID=2949628 RepID=UPI0020B24A2D|nr:winged helix-turn-helix transcriptional regulator [Bradyrhizobium sp. CCGUVB14]MCP3447615.1 winged helix-turn-helix transcriptional regulator [Bradyrhizobium sp. CCGUVB14]